MAPQTLLTCGLVGLPGCGKTTLFALLTGPAETSAFSGAQTRRVARVPDRRLDTLAAHFRPKKVTYAQIEVIDVPGLVPGEKSRTAHFLEAVRGSDALVYVLRDNPPAELSTLEAELILADLAAVERRIQRLEAGPAGRVSRKDAAVHASLVRVRDHLGEGRPYSDFAAAPEETEALAHTGFLSAKPVVWVWNVAEGDLATAARESGLEGAARDRGAPLVIISAQVEKEILQLPPEEAGPFMADLGLEEPGIARLARAVYERLGLVSFLTAGDDEVRAWTIRRGATAKAAAGKIHSDIERGFIRAEVVAYEDYLAAATAAGGAVRPAAAGKTGTAANKAGAAAGKAGAAANKAGAAAGKAGAVSLGERALVAAKEKALLRLEGKDYVVRDGDIISFRFNV